MRSLAVADCLRPDDLAAFPAAPLRIMLFLHSFEPGGVERIALRLAGAWAAAGCEVIVAMGRRSGPLAHEAPAGVAFEFAPPFVLAARCESLWLVPHLAALVRRRRPDVLFCAGNTYAIVAVLLRVLLGRACPPIVCKVSNCLARPDMPGPMRWFYRRWLRLQTRFIDRFVGLTQAMRAEMAGAFRLAAPRVHIVADPALRLQDIRCEMGPRGSPPREGRLFVAVGRLAAQKDFPLLLRAFAAGCGARDRLAILGEGPERRKLERLAARLGVADRVDLPGHVTDVPCWLARADALVLSSRYEGSPAVVIEALAQGVPVVATDCCVGMRDLLADGAFGKLVPRGDEQALSHAMTTIGRHRPELAALRRHVAEFTVERAAPRYLAIMSALLSPESHSGP